MPATNKHMSVTVTLSYPDNQNTNPSIWPIMFSNLTIIFMISCLILADDCLDPIMLSDNIAIITNNVNNPATLFMFNSFIVWAKYWISVVVISCIHTSLQMEPCLVILGMPF